MGGLLSVAQVYSDAGDRQERKEALEKLRKELTGEDNFAYFQIRPPVKSSEKLWIDFVQVGAVRDVAIGWYKKDKSEEYVDLNTWGGRTYTLIGQTVKQPKPIKSGNYRIDFRSPHNNWEQFFEISADDRILKEKIYITRWGKPILPRPIERIHRIMQDAHGAR